MADSLSKTSFVKAVFGIPDWYVLTGTEEEKLFKYICETRDYHEARLHRFLDCSAFCDDQFCFFCAAYEMHEIRKLCSSCHAYVTRQ